ncbi:uncharacterized protein LOC136744559 [Amia ocellicauda]|uniref:uncharacterized protein LOC136744559 n=1 Tax=Amia ocellicauda TaxID=2972642 RepID=UPI0034638ECB
MDGSPSVLLPEGWKQMLPAEQLQWVSKALFTRSRFGKLVLTSDLCLWWFPPQPCPVYRQPPASPSLHFARPLFLWMPYRMWAVKLTCIQPQCEGHRLTGAGLYKMARQVLSIKGWYDMVTEYLECRRCSKKYAGWSGDVLQQLDVAHWSQFPAILTYPLSCDYTVLSLMREHTLGNSATRLCKQLQEQHSEAWQHKTLRYLADCEPFVTSAPVVPSFRPPPPMPPVPGPKWLLAVYDLDVLERLAEVKAQVTSVFGSILKLDSTKKLTRKLTGAAAGTASWATNVGNEFGQVLNSVLMCGEGEGLQPMAAGLVEWYGLAGEAPPQILYVDWDCCSRPHLACIQDPEGVQLYTQTGQLRKGGVLLPVYRCARGSTSLESFHLHLALFIPGTSASDVHFQAYLLEGLVRWNADRAVAAVEDAGKLLRSYSGSLQNALGTLSQKVLARDLSEGFVKSGELIGIEYLYSQTGKELQRVHSDPDVPDEAAGQDSDREESDDEGFEEDDDPTISNPVAPSPARLPTSPARLPTSPARLPLSPARSTARLPPSPARSMARLPPSPEMEHPCAAGDAPPVANPEESCGPDGVPGLQHVQQLGSCLVDLRAQAFLTNRQVAELVHLWQQLPEGDKQRLVYPARHKDRLTRGRFKAGRRSSVAPGVDSLKRCMVGENTGPAQWPDTSHLVEAICAQLCLIHPSPTQTGMKRL